MKKLPVEVQVQQEKNNIEYFNGGKEIALTLARSPLFQLLGFVMAVKLMERIQVGDEPLLDSFWATSLLTTGVAAKTIETMAGSLDDAISIISAVKGLKAAS